MVVKEMAFGPDQGVPVDVPPDLLTTWDADHRFCLEGVPAYWTLHAVSEGMRTLQGQGRSLGEEVKMRVVLTPNTKQS